MPFELFSDVILSKDLPEEDLKAGDGGTVVERHVVPGLEDGYSVEVFDMTGATVAVVTGPASPAALAHARRPPGSTGNGRPSIETRFWLDDCSVRPVKLSAPGCRRELLLPLGPLRLL